MRLLTKIADLNLELIEDILTRALRYQNLYREGVRSENILGGKVVSMIFEKPSLRTKVAFEVATNYLGGFPVFLTSEQIIASGGNQKGRESVPDIARNLERFGDLIVARVYSHETIKQIAQSVKIPVINALCDLHHPTQALADLMTLKICFPEPEQRLTLAFIGDGNNVATSLMQICALSGINFRIASPKGYELKAEQIQVAQDYCIQSGSTLAFFNNAKEAAEGVDAIYADTFVSMGQESEKLARAEAFKGFQINTDLMNCAKSDAIFLHCLPAYRGEEVTNDVMDSKWSRVFDQAECRLHIAKALISKMLS
jgi:ornithine carbamoyltransferase